VMKWIYSVEDLPYPDASVLGGKGLALFQMTAAGLPVPKPVCIGTSAYDLFVDHNHLREKIGLELYRKSIRDMRWEEIWDASLRIKLLFMKAKIDGELEANILDTIRDHFGDRPWRSDLLPLRRMVRAAPSPVCTNHTLTLPDLMR